MRNPSRTVRLFVSSTFSDMKTERDLLQRRVFSELRAHCAKLGLRFQAIDLRWGVSEEAGRHNRTMRICLQELRRCQESAIKPDFLVLLGDRYGWRPLPELIPSQLFLRLRDFVASRDIALAGLFEQIYKHDANAVPEAHVLQPRVAPLDDASRWRSQVELPLLALLESAVAELGLTAQAKALGIGFSATHQEILHGALEVEDARQHVHVFVRMFRCQPGQTPDPEYVDPPEEGPADTGAMRRQRLLEEIEQRLGVKNAPESNVHGYTVDWLTGGRFSDEAMAAVASQIKATMLRVIDSQARSLDRDANEEEEEAQQDFATELCRGFVGRENALNRVARYLEETPGSLLAVLGAPGMGKSAFMAEAARRARAQHPRAIVVERYAGATPRSKDASALVRDLIASCRTRIAHARPDPGDLPQDLPALMPLLVSALSQASRERPIYLFLDGLDELAAASGGLQLHWLPWKLPPHVGLIASATLQVPGERLANGASQSPTASAATTLQRHTSPDHQILLQPLVPAEAEQLLNRWLAEAGRALQPGQKTHLLRDFAHNGSPLWLRIASIEAMQYSSQQAFPAFPSQTAQLMEMVLRRLSAEENHGARLVARSLGYLSCSRAGLAEDEILDLLSLDREVMADFRRRSPESPPVDALPVAVWASFRSDIARYLGEQESQGANLLRVAYRQMIVAAKALWPAEDWGASRHRQMAKYFQRQACPHFLREWAASPGRALSELPFQRVFAGNLRQAEHLFCDLSFLHESVQRGWSEQLYADLNSAVFVCGSPAIGCLRVACVDGAQAVGNRPASTQQILVNRLHRASLPAPLGARLARARQCLDQAGAWLALVEGTYDTRPVRNVVCISAHRGVCHTLSEDVFLEDRDLASHQLIEQHALGCKAAPFQVAVSPAGQVACVERSGAVFREGAALPLILRRRWNCFAFLGEQLIGVDSDHRLVSFDPVAGWQRQLASGVPQSFAVISVATGGLAAVALLGDEPATQRVLLLSASKSGVACSEWKQPGMLARDAAVNQDGTALLVADSARQLSLFHLRRGALLGQISSRSAAPITVLGQVEFARLMECDGGFFALLATSYGELLMWDVAAATLRYRGSFRGVREQIAIRDMAAIADKRQFVVATDESIQTLSLRGEDAFVEPTPITRCALSGGGWCVAANSVGKRVTWFRGQASMPGPFLWNSEPICVASLGDRAAVAVAGLRNGAVVRLAPGTDPGMEDAVTLFDSPVVEVLAWDGETVLAVSEHGEAKTAGFRPVRSTLQIPIPEPAWQMHFAARLGARHEVAICGRSKSGDCRNAVYLIRPGAPPQLLCTFSGLAQSLAATENAFYLVVDRNLRCYLRVGEEWRLAWEKPDQAEQVVVLNERLIALIVRDRDLAWLEIRSVEGELRTLASMELPFDCACLAGKSLKIVLGGVNGKHGIAEFRG